MAETLDVNSHNAAITKIIAQATSVLQLFPQQNACLERVRVDN